MKTKSILAIALLSVSALWVTSCSKMGDTIKPTIEIHEPENGEEFKPGSEMCLLMDLSDDNALKSFRVNIHNNFTDHGDHTSKHGDDVDGNYNSDTANAFKYDITSDDLGEEIKGMKNTHKHLHIKIDSTAAYGDYHLMVYCTDEAGNESYVARSIAITNDAEEHHHE